MNTYHEHNVVFDTTCSGTGCCACVACYADNYTPHC